MVTTRTVTRRMDIDTDFPGVRVRGCEIFPV